MEEVLGDDSDVVAVVGRGEWEIDIIGVASGDGEAAGAMKEGGEDVGGGNVVGVGRLKGRRWW